MSGSVPLICDYDCPHAAFPPAGAEGICRTMSAVWCEKLRELVSKNMPCEWRRRGGETPAGSKPRSRRTPKGRGPAKKSTAAPGRSKRKKKK